MTYFASRISTRPASMYWPPPVWWQWMATTFLPGLSAARAAGEIGTAS